MDRMKLQVGFGRRGFLRSAAIAGAGFWADETLDAAVQNVNRSSSPSDLKITDLRVAVVKDAPFVCPLIRIDTNQEIYGLGEVRDGASKTYALFLKSRLLGENPCNIDKIFRKIKQFGGDSRQAGGVLRGHHRIARPESLRPAPEGAQGGGFHLAENGSRHRLVA